MSTESDKAFIDSFAAGLPEGEDIPPYHAETMPLALAVYQLWWRWSDFELIVLDPILPSFKVPKRVEPAAIPGSDEIEFVYPILDCGNRFLTSKQFELFSAGLSMCKMHYTIEKIVALLMQRLLQSEDEGGGGITEETEVKVAFSGHEIAQRKAFESIINLNYNVLVTNFEPGDWGDRYLRVIKYLSENGYGYPSRAPRDIYKQPPSHKRPTPRG